MENLEKQKKLEEAISSVMHPAINFSLTDLGIIREYYFDGNNVVVIFAFPFRNIPIADILVNSVEEQVTQLGYSMEYRIELMTDNERENFLNMESRGWKNG